MKTCLICKKVVNDEFAFCPYCGASMENPADRFAPALYSEERFYQNAVMVGTTLKDYKGKEKTVVIPDGVAALEGPFIAWAENGVKEIFIPASVKKIARFTFSGMKSLERVVFETPNGWFYRDELISKNGVFRFNELAKPEVAAKYLTDLGNVVDLFKN